MKDYHQRLYFFFHDMELKIHAEDTFIRKVLSNLEIQWYACYLNILVQIPMLMLLHKAKEFILFTSSQKDM